MDVVKVGSISKDNIDISKLMAMDIKSILAFITVVESGNLYCASVYLGCSQPAISIYLKRVKSYFPERLFSREGRNLVPTEYALTLSKELKKSLTVFYDVLKTNTIMF